MELTKCIRELDCLAQESGYSILSTEGESGSVRGGFYLVSSKNGLIIPSGEDGKPFTGDMLGVRSATLALHLAKAIHDARKQDEQPPRKKETKPRSEYENELIKFIELQKQFVALGLDFTIDEKRRKACYCNSAGKAFYYTISCDYRKACQVLYHARRRRNYRNRKRQL